MECQDSNCPFTSTVHQHRRRAIVGSGWPLPVEEMVKFGLHEDDQRMFERMIKEGINPVVEYRIDPSRLEKLPWS